MLYYRYKIVGYLSFGLSFSEGKAEHTEMCVCRPICMIVPESFITSEDVTGHFCPTA